MKLITISYIIVVTLNFQKVKGLDLFPPIPDIIKNPIPNIIKNPIPNIINNPIPNIIPKESIPDIIKNPIPNIINNPIPNITPKEPIPDIIKNSIPNIIKNPIPNIINNPIPNIIPKEPLINPPIIGESNISNIINKLSKFGNEDVLKGILPKIENVTISCIKAYIEGRKVITQLSSILNSCLKKKKTETFAANTNVEKLSDLASDVKKNVYNTLHCLQQHPLNVTSCLNITKSLSELNVNELINVAQSAILSVYPFNLISLPDVIICEAKLVSELSSEQFHKFLTDAGHCIRSII